jgi:hypothetical protein
MLTYLFFAKGVVFERLCGLFMVDRGCEDVVQFELPWENVFEYVDCFVEAVNVLISIEDVKVAETEANLAF